MELYDQKAFRANTADHLESHSIGNIGQKMVDASTPITSVRGRERVFLNNLHLPLLQKATITQEDFESCT